MTDKITLQPYDELIHQLSSRLSETDLRAIIHHPSFALRQFQIQCPDSKIDYLHLIQERVYFNSVSKMLHLFKYSDLKFLENVLKNLPDKHQLVCKNKGTKAFLRKRLIEYFMDIEMFEVIPLLNHHEIHQLCQIIEAEPKSKDTKDDDKVQHTAEEETAYLIDRIVFIGITATFSNFDVKFLRYLLKKLDLDFKTDSAKMCLEVLAASPLPSCRQSTTEQKSTKRKSHESPTRNVKKIRTD
eukprot:TRINITY_DN1683_c0_g1_i1.p1 TRINITY_DN1683_c0_g1~~TRINITY_DN1683_c0_g1_i1.p1  ORF type:complete len:259 (-),score=67.48 TRINITY_DN1683_c0_g1_i1:117-842(-)